jgi:hypothetical protein
MRLLLMVTSKVRVIKKGFVDHLLTRGEVAAQEQIKIFRQAMATSKGEPRAPTTIGEVAAQEQIKIFRQAMATSKGEPRAPTTIGEVAAQEQMRIFGQLARTV